MSGQQLFTVRKAETPDDFSKVIALFQAYFTWRNVNLSLQDFAASSDIFTRYPPLLSVLLLADDMAYWCIRWLRCCLRNGPGPTSLLCTGTAVRADVAPWERPGKNLSGNGDS